MRRESRRVWRRGTGPTAGRDRPVAAGHAWREAARASNAITSSRRADRLQSVGYACADRIFAGFACDLDAAGLGPVGHRYRHREDTVLISRVDLVSVEPV